MVMIKEDYVSFETAKLLKEKGFDEKTSMVYMSYGELRRLKRYDAIRNSNYNDITKNYFEYTAPTLQRAMKWLRELHNLVVNPVTTSAGTRCYGEWEADIYYRDSGIDATINACGHIYGETYEEACDAGIRYCLKHLITYETKT